MEIIALVAAIAIPILTAVFGWLRIKALSKDMTIIRVNELAHIDDRLTRLERLIDEHFRWHLNHKI